jgi:small subunit ribosomal protein S16
MAVVIRLKRTGAKGRPFYRVVVADSRYPRDGRFIEQLGYYDPLTNPSTFKVDAEKFANWVRNGAKPSESKKKTAAKKKAVTKGSAKKLKARAKAKANKGKPAKPKAAKKAKK